MSLSAEAARLAAIECLAPTGVILAQTGFPTLAEARIFDSRAVAVSDLVSDRPFTPVISVYTRSSELARRGEIADYGELEAHAVLEFVAELAIAGVDENGTPYADAMAADDADARLILAALVAQIRFVLFASPQGQLFRRIAVPEKLECETLGVPELGLRWQRITARLTCAIADDVFPEDGGLPEPLKSLLAGMHPQSYARDRLEKLAAEFTATTRDELKEMVIRTAEGGEPIASVGVQP